MADTPVAGTPITDASSGYTNYTAEQLKALEDMKDPSFTFGIARTEFVNTALLPDGSRSTDLEPMKAAARAAVNALLSGDTSEPDVLAQATDAARVAKEIADHIKQSRFLFIVDERHLPTIYFRCVRDDDTDEELIALSPHADEHPLRVADHPDADALTAQRAEISARIAAVIDAAHAAATREI